jgi:demethylmenaquinone methyltransferase/2-methoxy-6-polyprenyl-1,4-benzoquinol methylase
MESHPAVVQAAARRGADHGFAYSCEPTVGALLAVLAAATPPTARILELGTGFGVGTAWLAHGLAGRQDVRLVTVERDKAIADEVAAYAWPVPVEVLTGDVESLLPTLGTFDLIFADAEGGKWSGLDLTIAALRPGAVLVVDDMDLDRYSEDSHRAAVDAVRQSLTGDPDLTAVELPTASGIILATRSSPSILHI